MDRNMIIAIQTQIWGIWATKWSRICNHGQSSYTCKYLSLL